MSRRRRWRGREGYAKKRRMWKRKGRDMEDQREKENKSVIKRSRGREKCEKNGREKGRGNRRPDEGERGSSTKGPLVLKLD